MDWLDSLQEEVLLKLRRPTISYETKQYVNHRLREERSIFERITRENAYEDFLLTHVQAEREKYLLYKRDGEVEENLSESPYDAVRENPVCTCDGKRAHQCPLKQGHLPREVRKADNLNDGIREFRAAHTGNPIVLQDAQESWADLIGEAEHILRDLLAILTSDEIPDDADWPGQDTEESTGQPAD